MKKSLKIIAVIALIIGSLNTLNAQQIGKLFISEGNIEKATLLMKKKYDLNEKQYYLVLELNTSFVGKVKPILLSDKSKMEKLLAIKPLAKEREKTLLTILDKEQSNTFITVKDERKALLKAWLED